MEIKKSGKKLEVSLTSGQIYFNVTEPLKVDESLNIRTSTMVTGIRGSFGWVNLTRMGLMHGHVTLTCTNPETGETRVTEVYTGEKVSYEQAAAARAEAEENRLNYEAAMAAAEQTSGQIIADATRIAEHRSNEIVAEAREKATELRRQAEADAVLERKKAEDDMKREIADVSAQLTGKLLQREINEEDHRALIDSFLQEMDSQAGDSDR